MINLQYCNFFFAIQQHELVLGIHMSWRRKWQPTPVSSPGKPRGLRSLASCSPRGCKESGTTEWLPLYICPLPLDHSSHLPPQWLILNQRYKLFPFRGQNWCPPNMCIHVCVCVHVFPKGFLLKPEFLFLCVS